jgi:hypothetical protein
MLMAEAVKLGLKWPYRTWKKNNHAITHPAPVREPVAELVHCIVCGAGLDISRSGTITCAGCKSLLTATVKITRTISLSVVGV